VHNDNFGGCKTEACWSANVGPVAARVPVVTGELGEDDCAHGYVDRYLTWADAKGISYLGWSWNVMDCEDGPALISDYKGTPTAYGVGLRDHLG
jgi:endoglucanase